MKSRDRWTSIGLFAAAGLAWVAVIYVITTYDPRDSSVALLVGAGLLGGALALTVAPVLWIATYVSSRRIGYRGAWSRAGRRAALLGLVVATLVVMRAQGAFSVPLVLFVVTMAVLVELTLSLRR
ncbi:MAG: hypothetical protein ABIP53_00020 [Candidatus Limnocylindrales bacterium]